MFRNVTVVLFLAALVLAGCTDRKEQAGINASTDITLQDLEGKPVNISDFQGKVVLLDFWATWCPPCRASIPALERLHKEYSGKGLVLLGISLDHGDWDYVKAFKAEYGITYKILKGNEDISDRFMVRTIPHLVLLDREGKVHRRISGYGGEEAVEKDLQSLL